MSGIENNPNPHVYGAWILVMRENKSRKKKQRKTKYIPLDITMR